MVPQINASRIEGATRCIHETPRDIHPLCYSSASVDVLRGVCSDRQEEMERFIGEPVRRENSRRAKMVIRLHYKQQRSTTSSQFRDGKQANAFVLILNLSVSPSSM